MLLYVPRFGPRTSASQGPLQQFFAFVTPQFCDVRKVAVVILVVSVKNTHGTVN